MPVVVRTANKVVSRVFITNYLIPSRPPPLRWIHRLSHLANELDLNRKWLRYADALECTAYSACRSSSFSICLDAGTVHARAVCAF